MHVWMNEWMSDWPSNRKRINCHSFFSSSYLNSKFSFFLLLLAGKLEMIRLLQLEILVGRLGRLDLVLLTNQLENPGNDRLLRFSYTGGTTGCTLKRIIFGKPNFPFGLDVFFCSQNRNIIQLFSRSKLISMIQTKNSLQCVESSRLPSNPG